MVLTPLSVQRQHSQLEEVRRSGETGRGCCNASRERRSTRTRLQQHAGECGVVLGDLKSVSGEDLVAIDYS